MDFEDLSEESFEEENHHPSIVSDTGRQTLSTDHDRPQVRKTKTIRKHYEPIKDGNIELRYEDNPIQYKKLRKKIQNRESAARVRGRKHGDYINLQKEVKRLQQINSELMLKNASLETQNKSLKEQVSFFRGLVKPNQNIDQYLNLDPPNTKKISEEYHFEDEENWIRSSNSSPVHSEWSTLFILTIIVGIFVIPADESQGNVSLAQQSSVSDLSHSILFGIDWLSFGKSIIKYVVVMGYLYFTVKFLKNRINWKKLKKL